MSDNDLALQEMMEIEIKFGKGKTDHVVVHYGDDPYSLAQVRNLISVTELYMLVDSFYAETGLR
ncbi:hypothetical protein EON65_30295 [archaeon]|nr:MAG: hypothetical protein EON65_30295 [archaeon]